MALIESIEATYRTGPVPEHHQLVGEARKKSAEDIWKAERGFAAGALIFGWLVKVSDSFSLVGENRQQGAEATARGHGRHRGRWTAHLAVCLVLPLDGFMSEPVACLKGI